MARKRRLRAKNRFGVVVPIDLAAEDVTMNNGDNLEQEIASIKNEIDQKASEAGLNIKIKDKTMAITSNNIPVVRIIPSSVVFEDTLFGQTKSAKVHVYGRNIEDKVNVHVSGVGFSGSTQLMPDIKGIVDVEVTITFAPTQNTGVQESYGKRYTGNVTVSSLGAEPASSSLQGYGIEQIVPRLTVTIDKSSLKGVKSDTQEGEYSSEPATATLHIQATNIDDDVILSVDNQKFTLSVNQVSIEDALAGVDVTVQYVRQAEVTSSNDEATITITATLGNESVTESIEITGATGAKIAATVGNTIATVDGVVYKYDSLGGMGVTPTALGGAVTDKEDYSVPTEFFDSWGYKYVPRVIQTLGGNSCSVKRLYLPSNIGALQGASKIAGAALEYVKMHSISVVRAKHFNGCTSLKTVELDYFKFNYSATQETFKNCTQLSRVILRGANLGAHDGDNFDKADDVIIRDFDSENGVYLDTTTTGTAYYYLDNNVKKQKLLYVQDANIASYRSHAKWGLFEVHALSELDE